MMLLPPARPRAVRTLAATTFLLAALVGVAAGETSVHSPIAPPPLAVSEDAEACQFAIRAENNIGEDVWILFSQSQVIMTKANFFSMDFKDMSNRRLAPGEKLNARYEAPGVCGARRTWGMTVRIGGRGGEIITVIRYTEGSNDRTVHLGSAACWALADPPSWEDAVEDRYIPGTDEAVGCNPESTRYGLAPAPEPDEPVADEPPAGEAGDETTGPAGLPAGVSLESNWVRRESNNPRNDGMRVLVEGDRATLVHTPPQAENAFSVGHVLWKGISANGRLEVRGSNGRYYPATIVMEGADRLNIDIDNDPGPGYEQTWERAGPSIDGDWVLVDATDSANEGLQLRVRGDRGTLLFVPPTAPRFLRVGDELWQGIGAGEQLHLGRLEALSSGRRHETAQFRLLDEKQLRVVFDAGGGAQLWVRPSIAERVKAAEEREERIGSLPQQPVDDPMEAGRDLQGPDEERTVDVPEELPPPAPEPEEEAACLATSLPDDQMDLVWGWGLTTAQPVTLSAAAVDALPANVRESYERSSALPTYEGAHQRNEIIADLDRSSVDGLDDHHSFLWQANPSGRRWEEKRDLTLTAYKQANEDFRDRSGGGYRPTDIEIYSTPAGMRYSGVWVANTEQIEWLTEVNLSRSEYERIYRESVAGGFRLVDMEARSTSNGTRYAAIWHKSCGGSDWRHRLDMERSEYQKRAENQQAAGLSLVDFESYRTQEGQRYAALWERLASPRAWRVRSDRTLKQFVNLHRQYVDLGFRLIDYESYDTANGIRYAGVWAENDKRYRYSAKNTLDTMIENYRQANDVPGISVAVVQNGDVIYRRGFGYANRQTRDTAHAETVYLTASVSKVIGATLAVRLEEKGIVDLEKSTKSYLPSLPPHHTHKVEQLLAKTGCVWHYPEGPEPNDSNFYRWRVAALVQIWNAPLLRNCDPGQHYRYSTHGFTFVGAVLEAAAGKDIAQLLRDELARPFDLPSLRAMFTGDGEKGYPFSADRARAYTLIDTTLIPSPLNPTLPTDYENNSWKVLGGGIEIHALDLARFGWKLLNGEIVSDSVRDSRLWKSQTSQAASWNTVRTGAVAGVLLPPIGGANIPVTGVGMAWNLGSGGNGKHVRHGGSARGARSYIRIWRDKDVVIAVLSNRRPHPVGSLVTNIASVVLNATPP